MSPLSFHNSGTYSNTYRLVDFEAQISWTDEAQEQTSGIPVRPGPKGPHHIGSSDPIQRSRHSAFERLYSEVSHLQSSLALVPGSSCVVLKESPGANQVQFREPIIPPRWRVCLCSAVCHPEHCWHSWQDPDSRPGVMEAEAEAHPSRADRWDRSF